MPYLLTQILALSPSMFLAQMAAAMLLAPELKSGVAVQVAVFAFCAACAAVAIIVFGRLNRNFGIQDDQPVLAPLLWTQVLLLVPLGLAALLVALWSQGYGHISIDGFHPAALWKALTLSLVAGVFEEILFRGVIQRVASDAFGVVAGVLVSATAFGLIHFINPGASWQSVICVAAGPGVFLALVFHWTSDLRLCMCIHGLWNFLLLGVLGASTSGFASQGMFAFRTSGNSLFTGGEFGIEGSIYAAMVFLLLSLVLGLLRSARARDSACAAAKRGTSFVDGR
jgi:membrane protease YdiL (CAAX protease family)